MIGLITEARYSLRKVCVNGLLRSKAHFFVFPVVLPAIIVERREWNCRYTHFPVCGTDEKELISKVASAARSPLLSGARCANEPPITFVRMKSGAEATAMRWRDCRRLQIPRSVMEVGRCYGPQSRSPGREFIVLVLVLVLILRRFRKRGRWREV